MDKINMDKTVKRKGGMVNPMPFIKSKICCSNSCARVKKTIWMLATVIIAFYGLVWVPSQQLELDKINFSLARQDYIMNYNTYNLALAKVKNSCKVISSNSLAAYEKQSEEKITDEQKNQLFNQFYANCLFVEGIQFRDSAKN